MKEFIRSVKRVNAKVKYSIYLVKRDSEHAKKSLYRVEKWDGGPFPLLVVETTINDVWSHLFDDDYILPRYVRNAIISERNNY